MRPTVHTQALEVGKLPWRQRLRSFLKRPAFDLTIGGLIVISVALTIIESSISEDTSLFVLVDRANFALTCIFVVELLLRYQVASSTKKFFKEYWIDILSVLPILRPFRVFRALRLLRLLRMFRLMGLFSRYASSFPYVVRRGALEYLIVSGIILLTILFGSSALLVFEKEENPGLDTIVETFWYSVYTLFANEPIPEAPSSTLGKMVSVFIMFMGMTVFAMLTGTISAFMIERLRSEGRFVDNEDLEGHVIICGWNRKAEIIIREYDVVGKQQQAIVVIADEEHMADFKEAGLSSRVRFLSDDFTKVSALEKAGVMKASTCIILADLSHGRNERDADARTILASLTVEKLNQDIYTCAEIFNREYTGHLELGHVNNYVLSNEQSALMLAQAAINRGMVGLLSQLLTYQHGNHFYTLPVLEEWTGKTFLELFLALQQEEQAILVAVYTEAHELLVNPPDYTMHREDSVIVICDHVIHTNGKNHSKHK